MTAPHKVWRLEIPDFAWLDRLNTTALTVLTYLGLLCVTCLVWSVCALAGIAIDPTALGLWLGAVAVIGGIVASTQKNYRTTDYGYQERQAEIERAKAQQAPTPQTTVNVAGSANVSGEGTK